MEGLEQAIKIILESGDVTTLGQAWIKLKYIEMFSTLGFLVFFLGAIGIAIYCTCKDN